MRNIQVCHDVDTLFIDRDGTTVLLEIRVDVTKLLLLFYQWSSAHGFSLDEERILSKLYLVQLLFIFFF